jgi:predicted Zn-dependent protease
LYLVELLTEKAEILLAQGEADAAESSARDALDLASAQQVQFLWGAALAGHVLGQALVQQGKMDAARKALHDVLTLRKRIGDPRTWQTEKLLNGLADTAGPGAEESP